MKELKTTAVVTRNTKSGLLDYLFVDSSAWRRALALRSIAGFWRAGIPWVVEQMATRRRHPPSDIIVTAIDMSKTSADT
ncbi:MULTISPECIES: hypothetical protein [Paraburkholderia]|uniref:Uncharacterized protein n=1 Tax=Paraburkholderia madseniana TaxID=2599607 RepID=A0AAP5BJN6_9BURK|nr:MULTISPECIES: hypothetical protein [Paraburkholderia]MCX4149959.1 hypothetical protein [Paraburkholderia madseniana]MDN7152895.1 hypothetical protein [Paraburkholderia sp. WS6]MDQ6411777.1 hypothetical protein [Paraburkholderia madseniana]